MPKFPTAVTVTEIDAAVVGRSNGVVIDLASDTGQSLVTPIVGPTATLTLRLLLNEFVGRSECHLADLGALLGMPHRAATFERGLGRLVRFRFATAAGNHLGVVRHAAFSPTELGRMHPLLADRYLAAAQAAAA